MCTGSNLTDYTMTTPSRSGAPVGFNADEAFQRLIHNRTPQFGAGGGTSLSMRRLTNMTNISASGMIVNSPSSLVGGMSGMLDGNTSTADTSATLIPSLITKATFASLVVDASALSISEGIDTASKVSDLLGTDSDFITTAMDATDSIIGFGRASGKLVITTTTEFAQDGTFNLLGADATSTPSSVEIMLAYNQRRSVGGVELHSAGSDHNPHDRIAEKAIQIAEAAFADILTDITAIQLRATNDFYDTTIAPALQQMQDAAHAAVAKAKEGAIEHDI